MRRTKAQHSPLLFAAVPLLALVLLLWGTGIRFNLTPSLPLGFYRYTSEEPQRGMMVTFCPPADVATFALERGYLHRGACEGGVQPLGKFILAVPGDTVTIAPDGLTVSGKMIPNSAVYWRDTMGRELLHFPFGRHVIGPDSLFMFSGHHPRSFDSRYFGPVASNRVISSALPLKTFAD